MRNFLFFIFILFMVSCSNIFWREGKLPPGVSWTKENTILISRVVFEEKDSWNPLMGTTLKQSYKTLLYSAEISGNTYSKLEKISVNLKLYFCIRKHISDFNIRSMSNIQFRQR